MIMSYNAYERGAHGRLSQGFIIMNIINIIMAIQLGLIILV